MVEKPRSKELVMFWLVMFVFLQKQYCFFGTGVAYYVLCIA